jgi:hypothetical protein
MAASGNSSRDSYATKREAQAAGDKAMQAIIKRWGRGSSAARLHSRGPWARRDIRCDKEARVTCSPGPNFAGALFEGELSPRET